MDTNETVCFVWSVLTFCTCTCIIVIFISHPHIIKKIILSSKMAEVIVPKF